ncbi:MAG: TetR family transcriptional regulator [Nitrolancea sp.]
MKPQTKAQLPALSLRERKKAKTRVAIQRHALRLFQKQGYTETTIEQIAAAAEVSPSTFFRYFPTKEDVVLWDNYDPLIVDSIREQPADVSPIRALRQSFLAVWQQMSEADVAEQFQRTTLMVSVPELRARALEQFTGTVQLVAEVLADRTGRKPDDPAVRNLAGAVIGVAFAVMLSIADDPSADIGKLFDDALVHLEAGLPL